MSLTIQQAQQAGQLAAGIVGYQQVVAALQEVVNTGDQIESMSATRLSNGLVLNAPITLSVADTAVMFSQLIGIYNDLIAGLQAQLAALG